jgi:hypothetical protein
MPVAMALSVRPQTRRARASACERWRRRQLGVVMLELLLPNQSVSGSTHLISLNRAKSVSAENTVRPCSIAKAAI